MRTLSPERCYQKCGSLSIKKYIYPHKLEQTIPLDQIISKTSIFYDPPPTKSYPSLKFYQLNPSSIYDIIKKFALFESHQPLKNLCKSIRKAIMAKIFLIKTFGIPNNVLVRIAIKKTNC